MPRVCGRLGPGDSARTEAMAKLLARIEPVADVTPVVEHPEAAVWASDGTVLTEHGLVAWAPAPLPAKLPLDQGDIATEHDAAVVDAAEPSLHSGISGAQPLYVDATDGAVHLATRVEPLARTRSGALEPDWDAWAHTIAIGAPLAGRTVFEGIRRLPPWTLITPGAPVPTTHPDTWPWLSVDIVPSASVGSVRDALTTRLSELDGRMPLASLLTGGWDSRVLATLAAHVASTAPTTWTTSSDHGHALEELMARQVADRLGVEHRIVAARWDEFGSDLAAYAETVDYQSSFHSWLTALGRALVPEDRTVLDGLGGGLFVGGDFPDTAGRGSPLDQRFDRLAHYLGDAAGILEPRVAAQVRERTHAAFTTVAEPLSGHPFAASFTAYLTRTVPGISMSPYGVIGQGSVAATPFLDDRVVRAALAIAPDGHAGGRLYPELIRPIAPDLADMPTAAVIAPNYRRHQRRISSVEGTKVIRDLVMREPARSLISSGLAAAELTGWQALLDHTRAQHLLRGLAMLSLWWERYETLIGSAGPDALREPVG